MGGRKPKYQGDRGGPKVKPGTALHYAFTGDFFGCCKVTDEAGDAGEIDKMGNTYAVLHQAVFWDDLDGVVMLTGRGAFVDTQTRQICPTLGVAKGSTPLHLAAIIGNDVIVRQLICDGADPAITDENGQTALDVAKTAKCIAALEGLGDLRARHERFADLVRNRSWKEAMDLVYEGFPANAPLPGHTARINDRFHAIHAAVRQGDIEAYANLIYAGAYPLQVTGSEVCEGKPPSLVCDETDDGKNIKPLVEIIEELCWQKCPEGSRPPPLEMGD